MTLLILCSFCSSGGLLIFCCGTNHPKLSAVKQQPLTSFVMILCIRGLGGAGPGDSPVPCGIDRGHLVLFSWPMGWFGSSRPALLTRLVLRQGWLEEHQGSPSSMAASGPLGDSHGGSELEERPSPLTSTILGSEWLQGSQTQEKGTWTPPLDGKKVNNQQLCFKLAMSLCTVSGPRVFSG